MDALLLEDLVAEDGRDPGLVPALLVVVLEPDDLGRGPRHVAGGPAVVGRVSLPTDVLLLSAEKK